MVRAYELYLFFHILATVVWLGSSVGLLTLWLRAVRTGDPLKKLGLAREAEFFGNRVFAPSGFVVLGFGFALVEAGGWGYPFWVAFGLAMVAVSNLLGMLVYNPLGKSIARLVEEHGPEHPAVQERVRRIFLIGEIELLLLVATVFDMVIKPFD